MMVILQLMIVSLYSRKTIKVQTLLTSKVGTISKYAQFLFLIERSNFNAQLLKELKLRLSFNGVENPSNIIRQLYRLLNWMDSNLNIIAAVVLNGLFLFNLQLLAAIEKWKSRYSEVIPQWFGVIGEFDALSSLANFAFNNPDYIYPESVDEQFIFEATDLGHPLIRKAECVTNSISISG